MSQPATGSAVLLAFRRELRFGVPDTSKSRVFYHPVPPLSIGLVRGQNASPEINSSGYMLQPVPGAITGPLDHAVMLTASQFLELIEHLYGGGPALTKSTLETNVYQYVASPVRPTSGGTSFDALVTESPVARRRLSGGRLSSVTVAIGNNTPLAARFGGFFSHETHLSDADADAGNTGTYTYGPDIRGDLWRPRDGETVAIDITRDVAGGGLQYKAERVPDGGTATFPGAAISVAYDSDGNGTWQSLVVAYQLTGTVSVGAGTAAVTGVGTDFLNELEVGWYLTIGAQNLRISAIASATALTLAANHTAGASGVVAHRLLADAGWQDENWDPCEIIFPGTSSDGHDDADVGDRWDFLTDWGSDPTPTYLSGQRFTSAHCTLDWRRLGASTWNEFQVQTGQFVFANAVTPDQGTGSRHYFGLDRDGLVAPTLQLVRKYLDPTFEEFSRSHEAFEMRLRQLGQKLGTGAYRESIAHEAPNAYIVTRTQPIAGPAAITETLNIGFAADAAGDPPLTTTVITDRDYTVAT